MKTKQDFQDAIAAEISNYPTAAQFYRALDPRLLASLDAMAVMLSMLSGEQDVAAAEPFTKSRDMTVLADASAKGVLPFGKSLRVQIAVSSSATVALSITAGRRILDSQGRVYVVDTGATVPAGGAAMIAAKQQSESSFQHTVTLGQPFYVIEVPERDPGKYVSEVRVTGQGGTLFKYTPEFVNVLPGEKVFHLYTDENRKLYIEFGASDLAGYQPAANEVLTVTVVETEGAVELAAGSKFAFEYSASLYESGATLTMDAVLAPGSAPMDVATMREVTSYPSIYDTSAVYLGNFDFLVRRTLVPFRFLSIWNEQTEEGVRGADVGNINTLFIAASKDGVATATLRDQISAVIKKADDSYKLSFIDVVSVEIPVAIVARVPAIYDFAAVEQQMQEIVLAEYGPDSPFARRGQNKLLYKRLYDLLVTGVQALQGETSDLQVTITDPAGAILPEHYRYVSATSLTITVEQSE